MAQPIRAFVRCRPLRPNEPSARIQFRRESSQVVLADQTSSERAYLFDEVFDSEANQGAIYDSVAKPLIKQVLTGQNGTVFAYGQTGTGKTYTMEGEPGTFGERSGLIPRAIQEIFYQLEKLELRFIVRVSFLELYQEDTYDLLSPLEETTKLRIFDDTRKKGSVIVGGLTQRILHSTSDIHEVLKQGTAKRQTAATLLNACSSRSHTIFSVTVHVREPSADAQEMFRVGKLNLVDLAGSENIGRSGAQDKRAREAGNINQSLLTLGRVMNSLIEKRPHVPYRESNLTRLLQDSLGGTTSTSILATISPSESDLSNTLSTLDYASRARSIVNHPQMNQRLTRQLTPSNIDLNADLQAVIDRHTLDLCQQEMKIRNEVAQEFKREMEKIRASLKETYDREIDLMRQELKTAHELAEHRQKMLTQLTDELCTVRAELCQLKEICQNQEVAKSKKSRVPNRKRADDQAEYANMTFDGRDEIIAKGSVKKQPRKMIPTAHTPIGPPSGKKQKKKVTLEDEIEFAPDLSFQSQEQVKQATETPKRPRGRPRKALATKPNPPTPYEQNNVQKELNQALVVSSDDEEEDEIARVAKKARPAKRKIDTVDETELSPNGGGEGVRLTRSRTVRRKLNF